MKKLLCLLLTLALLAGCTPKPPETTAPTEPPRTTAATQPPTEAPVTILDRAAPWENDPQLVQLQLPVLEELWDNIQPMDSRLLLSRIDYSEDGTQGNMTLCAVDLYTGEEAGRLELPIEGYGRPQIFENTVVLCDSTAGLVSQWDENLQPVEQWTLTPDDGSWVLGLRDGEKVIYHFGYRRDLMAENLKTGAETRVLRKNRDLWAGEVRETGLYTTCVEEPNLLCYPCLIDLLTGEVRRVPVEKPLISATCVNGVWFGQAAENPDYCLIRDGEVRWIRQEFSNLQQLTDGNILEIGFEGTDLTVYGPDGTALGFCSPTRQEEQRWMSRIEWCELLGGYLVPVYEFDGGMKLLLWRLPQGYEGEPLPLEEPPESEGPVPGTAVDAALYERAQALGEVYGVEIYIADQIDTDSSTFTVEPMLDEEQIREGLDLLEQVLGSYPEGFFRQLRWENVRRLQIHLGSRIYSGDSYRIDSAYSGFVIRSGDACQVVISLGSSNELTYAHEFSHVIDQKLQWDSECRSDSPYSEEAWMALNPEGFAYTYDYGNVAPYFEGEDRELYGWFLSPYGTVNPTEDRAQVMEAAVGIPWAFDEGPGMLQKLRWYSDCIRDCFDTAGWPEITIWEQILN